MELLGSQTTAAGIFFLRYQNKHFCCTANKRLYVFYLKGNKVILVLQLSRSHMICMQCIQNIQTQSIYM